MHDLPAFWVCSLTEQGCAMIALGRVSGSSWWGQRINKLWNTSTWLLDTSLEIPQGDTPLTKPSDKSGPARFVMAVAWSMDGMRLACRRMDCPELFSQVCVEEPILDRRLSMITGLRLPLSLLCTTCRRLVYFHFMLSWYSAFCMVFVKACLHQWINESFSSTNQLTHQAVHKETIDDLSKKLSLRNRVCVWDVMA